MPSSKPSKSMITPKLKDFDMSDEEDVDDDLSDLSDEEDSEEDEDETPANSKNKKKIKLVENNKKKRVLQVKQPIQREKKVSEEIKKKAKKDSLDFGDDSDEDEEESEEGEGESFDFEDEEESEEELGNEDEENPGTPKSAIKTPANVGREKLKSSLKTPASTASAGKKSVAITPGAVSTPAKKQKVPGLQKQPTPHPAKKTPVIAEMNQDDSDDDDDDEEMESEDDEEESEDDDEEKKETPRSEAKKQLKWNQDYPEKTVSTKTSRKPEEKERKRKTDDSSAVVKSKTSKMDVGTASKKIPDEEKKGIEMRDRCELFVKNFPPDVNLDQFKKLSPDIINFRRPFGDKKKKGKIGWLTFANEEMADQNYKLLQGTSMGGRKLFVDYCGSRSLHATKASNSTNESPKENRSVLYVGNIPPTATKPELKTLFPSAAEVRITKRGGKSRTNIAFISFSSMQDAKRVLESAESIKLRGMPLSISYARTKEQDQRTTPKQTDPATPSSFESASPVKKTSTSAASKAKETPKLKDIDMSDEEEDDDDLSDFSDEEESDDDEKPANSKPLVENNKNKSALQVKQPAQKEKKAGKEIKTDKTKSGSLDLGDDSDEDEEESDEDEGDFEDEEESDEELESEEDEEEDEEKPKSKSVKTPANIGSEKLKSSLKTPASTSSAGKKSVTITPGAVSTPGEKQKVPGQKQVTPHPAKKTPVITEMNEDDSDDDDEEMESEEESEEDEEKQETPRSEPKKQLKWNEDSPEKPVLTKPSGKPEEKGRKRKTSDESSAVAKRKMPKIDVGTASKEVLDEEKKRIEMRDRCSLFVKNFPPDVKLQQFRKLSPDIINFRKPFGSRMKTTHIGWLAFASEEMADKNYKLLQGASIGSRKLFIDYCGSKSLHAAKTSKSTSESPKINRLVLYVSNIPPTTTKAELNTLFPSATDVRIPKSGGKGRNNIAFVSFSSVQDAKRVFESAESIKVGGVRLSISYARIKEQDRVSAVKQTSPAKPSSFASASPAKKTPTSEPSAKETPKLKPFHMPDEEDDDDDMSDFSGEDSEEDEIRTKSKPSVEKKPVVPVKQSTKAGVSRDDDDDDDDDEEDSDESDE